MAEKRNDEGRGGVVGTVGRMLEMRRKRWRERGGSSFAGITRYFPGGRVTDCVNWLASARSDGEENNGHRRGFAATRGRCVGSKANVEARRPAFSSRTRRRDEAQTSPTKTDRVYRRQIKRGRMFPLAFRPPPLPLPPASASFVVADPRIRAQAA